MSRQDFPFTPARWRYRLRSLGARLAAPVQAEARELAARLEVCQQPAREAFARLCPWLCPSCQNVCCLRVSPHGLLDQADLIYFAALGLTDLPYPRPREKGCPFLERAGCALPWRARPFACLHYLCPQLSQTMGPAERVRVEKALEEAAGLRARLVAVFLDAELEG